MRSTARLPPSSAPAITRQIGRPWYNLGLAYKRQRRWPESLRCNLRAAELDLTDEAAWWNAGIAATALGEREIARLAWETFGIELPPGEGEIRMRLGPTPIRLNPTGNGEADQGNQRWCNRSRDSNGLGLPSLRSMARLGCATCCVALCSILPRRGPTKSILASLLVLDGVGLAVME